MGRRRRKPVSLLAAILLELGTLLAIIALAQPTWTGRLIETVGTKTLLAPPSRAPPTQLESNRYVADSGPYVDYPLGSEEPTLAPIYPPRFETASPTW